MFFSGFWKDFCPAVDHFTIQMRYKSILDLVSILEVEIMVYVAVFSTLRSPLKYTIDLLPDSVGSRHAHNTRQEIILFII